jgi:hypothetical protein
MEATTESRRLDPVTLIDPIPSFSQVYFRASKLKQAICQMTGR